MEAVAKGLAMVAELNEAKAKLLLTKREQDAVRLADPTKQVTADANAKMTALAQETELAFTGAMAEARLPLEEAQRRFDVASSALHQERLRRLTDAQAAAEATILEAKREQETKNAIAGAEVHTVQQEVMGHEASIDRYTRQVEQQLGINLKQMLSIAKE